MRFSSLFAAGASVLLGLAMNASAAVVADFGGDFSTNGTPKTGWSYSWNASGAIGNSANYQPLVGDTNFGGDYESQANGAWPDAAPGSYVAISQSSFYPGQTATQDAGGIQRYAIAGYTFSAADIAADGNGLLFHTYHFIVPADAPGLIDVKVYKNNTLIAPFTFPPGTDFSDAIFGQDYNFGTVAAGDTLYIGLGAEGDYTGQPLGVSYTLALVPEPTMLSLLVLVPALGLRRRQR